MGLQTSIFLLMEERQSPFSCVTSCVVPHLSAGVWGCGEGGADSLDKEISALEQTAPADIEPSTHLAARVNALASWYMQLRILPHNLCNLKLQVE